LKLDKLYIHYYKHVRILLDSNQIVETCQNIIFNRIVFNEQTVYLGGFSIKEDLIEHIKY